MLNNNINIDNYKNALQGEDELEKKFNCVKCSIKLKDVKLLKMHFWQVHISKNEIFNHMKPTESYLIRDKPKKFKRKNGEENNMEKSKKRKHSSSYQDATSNCNSQVSLGSKTIDDSLDDTLDDIDNFNSSLDGPIDSEMQLLRKVKTLKTEDIKNFHFAKDIDENKFYEFYQSKDGLALADKKKELKSGSIVWAKWKSIGMWPARVENVICSKNHNIRKVTFRYFEVNHVKSHIFKTDPSKIELFYRSVENHIKYKENQAKNNKLSYEFLLAYTDALEEFYDQFENEMASKNSNSETTNLKNSDNFNQAGLEKYFINDVLMNIDEITKLAEAPLSEKQLQINKEREEDSKKLFDTLKSNECKDFIISILTNSLKCDRHSNYINGTLSERKEMKFKSTGPLVVEDQKKLAEFLIDLSLTYFSDKPMHLKDYEYDVLYPEAVIWGIQHLYGISEKKAISEYEEGFKLTPEEMTKTRCNEILIKYNQERTEKNRTWCQEIDSSQESINFSIEDSNSKAEVEADIKTALDDIINTAIDY